MSYQLANVNFVIAELGATGVKSTTSFNPDVPTYTYRLVDRTTPDVIKGKTYDNNTNVIPNSSFTGTASAPITKGSVVSIDKNGNIVNGYGLTTQYILSQNDAQFIRAAMLTTGVYVVVYHDNNNGGLTTAVILTISNGVVLISIPTVTGGNVALNLSLDVTALSSTVFAIAGRDQNNSNRGKIIIGTVAGTGNSATITFNTPANFNSTLAVSDTNGSISLATISSTVFVIAFRDTTVSNSGNWIVGTVSGSGGAASVTFNTKAQFNGANSVADNQLSLLAVTLDSTRFIVFFYDGTNINFNCIIGTISGTGAGATVTAGPITTLSSTYGSTISDIGASLLDTNKLVLSYRRGDGSLNGSYVAIITTTNSLVAAASQLGTFQTPLNFLNNSGTQYTDICIIAYSNTSDGSRGECVIGIVSGNTITASINEIFNYSATFLSVLPYNSSTVIAIARNTYFNNQCSATLLDISGSAPSLNNGKGLFAAGIASSSVTTGQSVNVVHTGIVDGYTNLIPGRRYYAKNDGTISLINSPVDNTYITRFLGIAISTTQLIIHYE